MRLVNSEHLYEARVIFAVIGFIIGFLSSSLVTENFYMESLAKQLRLCEEQLDRK